MENQKPIQNCQQIVTPGDCVQSEQPAAIDMQPKSKTGKKLHKKILLAALAVVVVIALLFAMLPLMLGDRYDYYKGKMLIAIGQYEKAYYLLRQNDDDSVIKHPLDKDKEKLLEGFVLLCGEKRLYDAGGTVVQIYTETYDEDLGTLTYTTCNGSGLVLTQHVYEYKNGNEVCWTSYRGTEVESKRVRQYNEDGQIAHQAVYDGAGNLLSEFKFQNGQKVQEIEYAADGSVAGETNHTYDEKGNLILSVAYNADGNVDYRWERTYDDNGNLLSDAYQDSTENGYRCEYTYTKDGQILTETNYGSDGAVTNQSTYQYDNKGNILQNIRYDAISDLTTKWEYTYDGDGNCLTAAWYDENGNVNGKRVNTYDKKGNLTMNIGYDSEGKMSSKSEYVYDEDGNKTQEIIYEADGSVSSKVENTYDAAGNKISYTNYDGAGNVTGSGTYTYDENGNKTSQLLYDESGNILTHVECENYLLVYLPNVGK